MTKFPIHNSGQVVELFPIVPALRESNLNSVQPHMQFTGAALNNGMELNIPKGVGYVLVQALTQNIRYTISGTTPTSSSGFRLVAGNDPIAIPVVPGRTRLLFISETSGAVLELQYAE